MNRARGVRALVARLALTGIAAVVLAFVTPGAALALEVHHIYPLPGSTSATAPDHLEVRFDDELQPAGADGHLAGHHGRARRPGPAAGRRQRRGPAAAGPG